MTSQTPKNIFLSASIPRQTSAPKYFETADVGSIRDAVIALTLAVIPKHRLVWGGHPTITPLIGHVMSTHNRNTDKHLTLYQSKFFQRFFREDNRFPDIVQTEEQEDRSASLRLMRDKMLSSHDFAAGVFIGGMEGVEEEYRLFSEKHPQASVIVLSSTGAAAKIIDRSADHSRKNIRFESGHAYSSVFQRLLAKI